MSRDRTQAINDRIYSNILRLMGDRKQSAVCKKADVPESTLSTQLAKKRFTLELLAPLAPALGTTVTGLMEEPPAETIPTEVAAAAFYRVMDNVEWAQAIARSGDEEELARVLAGEVAPRIPPDHGPGQGSGPTSSPGSKKRA